MGFAVQAAQRAAVVATSSRLHQDAETPRPECEKMQNGDLRWRCMADPDEIAIEAYRAFVVLDIIIAINLMLAKERIQ